VTDEPTHLKVWDERVVTAIISDTHAAGQMLDRLEWALQDAERIERTEGPRLESVAS